MTQHIKDLKEGTFVGEALLTEKTIATAKNGSQYADLVFSDKTGTIKCKQWNYKDDTLETNKVYLVTMQVSTYQGALQGVVSICTPTQSKPEDFIKGSRFSVEEMFEDVVNQVNSFTEPLTRYIVKELLAKMAYAVKKAPAAKGQHNAWHGGLIEHMWSMSKCAAGIIEHYKTKYSPKLSSDKVLFGVFTHDLGKVMEYSYDGGIGYTAKGLLTPHIVLGPCWVYELSNKWYREVRPTLPDPMTAPEFERERDHLMHIIAAHHGKAEWGSPVSPSTLEAILVHQIDMIDSKFMHALELVEGKEGQIKGFSDKSWSEKTHFMQYN